MNSAYAAIACALIGGPLMLLMRRFDRRNTAQHGQDLEILQRLDGKVDRIDAKVDRLDTKLDSHLNDPRRHK